MTAAAHRVVIVGAGFGGLAAARALRGAPVEVTVVDRMNHHLFQPLLYQVATALLPPGDVAPAIRDVLRGQHNAKVLLGEVVGFDTAAKEVDVVLSDGAGRKIGYDTLVVAAGATDSYFGHDEWREVARPMKTLADAIDLRSRLLSAFENAAAAEDPAECDRWMTIAIVGAGPTGVELAGQVAAMARRTLRRQFRGLLDPTRVRIVLLDAVDSVLPPFSPKLREHTRRTLEKLGVEVRLGKKVTGVDGDGVVYEPGDERLPARTVIWSAGVKASPLAEELAKATGAESDRKGRILVEPDCAVPGHPEIFAIGDMISLNDIPGVAAPAIQEGRYVAKVIGARLARTPRPGPFRYHDRGTMATVSPGDAVADVRGLKLTGFIGKLAWALVHLTFLVGWRNRAAVMLEWAWLVTTGRRSQRIILEPAQQQKITRTHRS
ncbi:NAD(P)/FAD-dependent oxidoreductase [Allokutzneria albata]|uniref:NADH:ubiquinone reductase (non-electrogenic) n=1 Tax=Allokutzneria albata TaxID=211114 RepID=A0A1G9URU8_ALLAB|nr:NAD(P)/FAD-dependent oxidoreductase [Allokutzneria albata]SDM62681.1 NADH dehydrogenase [Allokutzneria albata]